MNLHVDKLISYADVNYFASYETGKAMRHIGTGACSCYGTH